MNVEPEIEARWVNTGQVRLVAKNYPFLGPDSFLAAEAAEAAAARGKYWAYRTRLFQRTLVEGRGAFRPESLKRVAAEVGLDQRKFDAALDNRRYQETVLAERREADALGIHATPSFHLNGRALPGVPKLEEWERVIEQELAKK